MKQIWARIYETLLFPFVDGMHEDWQEFKNGGWKFILGCEIFIFLYLAALGFIVTPADQRPCVFLGRIDCPLPSKCPHDPDILKQYRCIEKEKAEREAEAQKNKIKLQP
jgi:hypothetical protein